MSLPSGKEAVTSAGSSERLAHLACLVSRHHAPGAGVTSIPWQTAAPRKAGKSTCKKIRDGVVYPGTANESVQETINELFGRTLGHPEVGSCPKSSHQARSACGSRARRPNQTLLERAAVAPRNREEYRHKLELFKAFCAAQKLPQRKAADVDWALLLFVNQAFLQGWDVRTLCTSRSPSNSQSTSVPEKFSG